MPSKKGRWIDTLQHWGGGGSVTKCWGLCDPLPQGWLNELCSDLGAGMGRRITHFIREEGKWHEKRGNRLPAFWELWTLLGHRPSEARSAGWGCLWKRGSQGFGKQETPQHSEGNLGWPFAGVVNILISKPNRNSQEFGDQPCALWKRRE